MAIKRRDVLRWGGMALGSAVTQQVPKAARAWGTPASALASSDGNVATAPAGSFPAPAGMVAPQRGDVRLVVLSDINGRYRSTSYNHQVMDAISLIPAWQPDAVICAGDMVAGQLLSLTSAEIEAMWNGFDRHIFQPIRQAGLPYAFTLGNHDASNHVQRGAYVFGLERDMANAYWNTPGRDLGFEFVDRAGFPFYYSFVQRGIFYLSWDASSATVPDAQVAWAQRSLASPAAQAATMRIVLGHLPLYGISQGRDRQGEILNRPYELRSLLERHDVQLYISGHHHAYYPGHVGSGLNLLHCGALGSGPRTWLDSVAASIHTLTVVDIDLAPDSQSPAIRYTTYDMTSKQRVDETQLPRVIVGPTGRVWRQDLAWADLTTEEQSRSHRPSAN